MYILYVHVLYVEQKRLESVENEVKKESEIEIMGEGGGADMERELQQGSECDIY